MFLQTYEILNTFLRSQLRDSSENDLREKYFIRATRGIVFYTKYLYTFFEN